MRNHLRTLTVFALCMAGFAAAGDTPKGKSMAKDVIWPAEAIKWEDGPAPGTHVAKLWGDMAKPGPYGVLIKFDPGVVHPLHWHTRSLKIVIISGSFLHRGEDGAEMKLGPGSYALQAGGNKHISGSVDGPCEFFMTGSGKFDMKMVEAAKK